MPDAIIDRNGQRRPDFAGTTGPYSVYSVSSPAAPEPDLHLENTFFYPGPACAYAEYLRDGLAPGIEVWIVESTQCPIFGGACSAETICDDKQASQISAEWEACRTAGCPYNS